MKANEPLPTVSVPVAVTEKAPEKEKAKDSGPKSSPSVSRGSTLAEALSAPLSSPRPMGDVVFRDTPLTAPPHPAPSNAPSKDSSLKSSAVASAAGGAGAGGMGTSPSPAKQKPSEAAVVTSEEFLKKHGEKASLGLKIKKLHYDRTTSLVYTLQGGVISMQSINSLSNTQLQTMHFQVKRMQRGTTPSLSTEMGVWLGDVAHLARSKGIDISREAKKNTGKKVLTLR